MCALILSCLCMSHHYNFAGLSFAFAAIFLDDIFTERFAVYDRSLKNLDTINLWKDGIFENKDFI